MSAEPTPINRLPAAQCDVGERLVGAFLEGRSARTITAYARDLEAFRAHLGASSVGASMGRLLSAPQGEANRMALAFRTAMIERQLAPATVNRRLAALRSALKLGRLLGFTANAIEIPNLRSEAYRDVRGPGAGGMQALLNAARQRSGPGRTKHRAVRDVAALRLTYDLALRRAELLALRRSDIDGDRIWLLRKGKSQKVARTLPAETLRALAAWLKVRDGYADGHDFVFISLANNSNGRPLTADGWHAIVGALGAEVGIKARPHGIRHASITAAAVATGGNMVEVQEHSGHADISTARRYVAAASDAAGKVAAAVAASIS